MRIMNSKHITFLSVFFLAVLFSGFLYITAHAAGADGKPIEYIDENGEVAYCEDYSLLNTDNFPDEPGIELGKGWYVVQGNVTYENRIKISSEYYWDFTDEENEEYGFEQAVLILCDGCNLDLKQGIELEQDYGLKIYAERGGTGTLNAEYRCNEDDDGTAHAVIGGNAPKGFGGCLDINGGRINVNGFTYGAGIGGSVGGSLEMLNIRGGLLNVVNTAGGPAIGVGLSYSKGHHGMVTISGGEVHADSNYMSLRTSDAIGGHYECNGLKELKITGGKVTAFGRYATVGMDPCSMMTHGDLVLGDDMAVSAGSDPDHIKQVSKADRVKAIRSNCYAEVSSSGSSGSSVTGTTFSGGTAAIILAATAIITGVVIVAMRKKRG